MPPVHKRLHIHLDTTVDLSRKNLNRILKELPRAKDYYSMSVQLTREEVREAYKAFFALRKEGKTNHQAPGFRRKGYLSPLRYVQSGYKVEGDRATVSLGTGRKEVKSRFLWVFLPRPKAGPCPGNAGKPSPP